jgi:hypothetical protein
MPLSLPEMGWRKLLYYERLITLTRANSDKYYSSDKTSGTLADLVRKKRLMSRRSRPIDKSLMASLVSSSCERFTCATVCVKHSVALAGFEPSRTILAVRGSCGLAATDEAGILAPDTDKQTPTEVT